MSAQDNNLLNFLKKKSLFNQSPIKNPARRRSRSKSKDKESIIRKINDRDFEEELPQTKLFHNKSEKHLKNTGFPQRT